MRLISFLFALARVYLPIPSEFKVDMEETRRDGQAWYDSFKEPEKRKKKLGFLLLLWDNILENWVFRVILMFLIVPIGVRLKRSLESGERDDADTIKMIMDKLNENN